MKPNPGRRVFSRKCTSEMAPALTELSSLWLNIVLSLSVGSVLISSIFQRKETILVPILWLYSFNCVLNFLYFLKFYSYIFCLKIALYSRVQLMMYFLISLAYGLLPFGTKREYWVVALDIFYFSLPCNNVCFPLTLFIHNAVDSTLHWFLFPNLFLILQVQPLVLIFQIKIWTNFPGVVLHNHVKDNFTSLLFKDTSQLFSFFL